MIETCTKNVIKKYRLIASYRQCSFTRTYFRCRRLNMSYKKAALKHFVRFTGKHLSWSLSFNKVADYRQPQYYMTSSIWQYKCLIFQDYFASIYVEKRDSKTWETRKYLLYCARLTFDNLYISNTEIRNCLKQKYF